MKRRKTPEELLSEKTAKSPDELQFQFDREDELVEEGDSSMPGDFRINMGEDDDLMGESLSELPGDLHLQVEAEDELMGEAAPVVPDDLQVQINPDDELMSQDTSKLPEEFQLQFTDADGTIAEGTSALPMEEPQNNGANLLRFLLMPFVCLWAFGLMGSISLPSNLSGFAIPAFFILTGYFVLVPEKEIRTEKLRRATGRTLLTFVVMFLTYIMFNLFLGIFFGADPTTMLSALTLQKILDFLLLNLWPYSMGQNIWFIHSLLYAWLLLRLFDRTGLLRYYKIILLLSMLFMLLTGELAGVIGFYVLGHYYLPGGALTRALPYLLLGMLMREKEERIAAIPTWVYLLLFVLGAAMVWGEIRLLDSMGVLVYVDHLLGVGVMAFAACGWALAHPNLKPNFFSNNGRRFSKWIYVLANPVYYVLIVLTLAALPQFVMTLADWGGIIAYVVSLLLCLPLNRLLPKQS